MPRIRNSLPDPVDVDLLAGLDLEQVGAWSEYPDGLLEVLQWLCHRAVTSLPGARGAGVVVRFRGAPFSLTWTAAWVKELHQAEIVTGGGPALRALDTRRVVSCTRADVVKAFPSVTASFVHADVGAVRVEPLPIASQAIGVFTLYGALGRAFDAEPDLLRPVKTRLLTALSAYCAAHHHEDHAIRLHRELNKQQLLGDAVAILMSRHQVGPEEAETLLADRVAGGNVSPTTAARAVIRQHLAAGRHR